MNTKPIAESEYAPLRISALPSRPTASSAFGGKGYTATQLKAAFDRLPLLLIERFNRLLSDIESTGAGSLAADLPTGIEEGHTLSDFFEDVKSGTLATYLGVGGRSLAEALDKAEATLDEMDRLLEDTENGKLATYLLIDTRTLKEAISDTEAALTAAKERLTKLENDVKDGVLATYMYVGERTLSDQLGDLNEKITALEDAGANANPDGGSPAERT